jgi:hypothetical protein
LLVAVVAAVTASGLPSRFAPTTLRLIEGRNDGSKLMYACTTRRADTPPCIVGASVRPSFVAWGDSHAGMMGDAFDLVGRSSGRAGLVYPFGGCLPLIDPPTQHLLRVDRPLCVERNRLVMARIVGDPSIRLVVLAAYWPTDPAKARPVLRPLSATLAALREHGKSVTVIGGLPAPGFDLPWALGVSRHVGVPLPAADPHTRPSPEFLAVIERQGARFIDLAPPLCSGGSCPLIRDGRPVFVDGNHLSRTSVVTFVAPYLKSVELLR